MVYTVKFSEFPAGTLDEAVGLAGGTNTRGPGGGGTGGAGVTKVIVQPNSFSLGQWLRFDEGSQLYVTALAVDKEQAEVVGVVVAVAPPGAPPYSQFTLQQSGPIYPIDGIFAGGTFVGGQPQFLSDTTPGALMANDVIIDGEVSRPVFLPDSDAGGWVLPYRGMIETGGDFDGGGGDGNNGGSTSIVTVSQDAHGLAPGEWVRVTTPQAGPQVHYIKAIATSLQNSQAVGVVIEVINVNAFRLQFSGYVKTDVATSTIAPFQDEFPTLAPLVPSTVYYLSSTDDGAMTSVDPGLSAGGFSKPLYISEQTSLTVNVDAGYVLPQRPLPQRSSGNVFLGTLNAANGYSSTTIFQDSFGNTFNNYLLLCNAGLQFDGTTSNASIGFRFFAAGSWQTTPGQYFTYTSGVNSTAGLNTATWWGYVANSGFGSGRDHAVILPPFTDTCVLSDGHARIYSGPIGIQMQFHFYTGDFGTEDSDVGYTSNGTTGCETPAQCTGLQLYSEGNPILTGNAEILIYGIPT